MTLESRISTISIIESLQITNADLPNSLFSRLPIRDNSIMPSLTSSSDNIAGRHKDINQR